MRRTSLALLLFLVTACSTAANLESAREVPLLGRAAEQRQFAGTWTGAVTFDEAHRDLDLHVTFVIVPSDTGTGHLVLPANMPQPALSYVRIDGNRMLSAAAPQFERSCECTVYTTLEGELNGHVITGHVRRIENRSRVVTGTVLFARSPS